MFCCLLDLITSQFKEFAFCIEKSIRSLFWVYQKSIPFETEITCKLLFTLTALIRINSKDLPNMNTFCDWLFETIVISVYDSFFRNYISIVLLSFIVCNSQSQCLFI